MKKLLIATLLVFFGFTKESDRPVHIFMIGDSTMANKRADAVPETGWGQVLNTFFSSQATIDNRAQNGRSSKSFLDEGRWKAVLDSLQKGDYVIIQFGHNDSKPDSARHTDPKTSYRANLEKFVNETRAKGATPILCTSIVRRHFDESGNLKDTHGDYPVVTREVATAMNVSLVDMEAKTRKMISALGPEKSKEIYLFLRPGSYPRAANGLEDSTHLCKEGATKFAGLFVEGIKEQNLPLTKLLK